MGLSSRSADCVSEAVEKWYQLQRQDDCAPSAERELCSCNSC